MLHVHVPCITCIYHSLLAQVVLPAYIIAPVKIHAEIGFTDTCICVLVWLSLYYFQHLLKVAKKKGDLSFMEIQKSYDSINEGLSLTMEGPPKTNVVHVPMSHLRQIVSLISISNYILLIPVICLVALHSYTNLHTFV